MPFLHYPTYILLRPLGALGDGDVPYVQFSPGHQHVSPGSPWMGEVYLLLYDDGVPDIMVTKMYPHLRPC